MPGIRSGAHFRYLFGLSVYLARDSYSHFRIIYCISMSLGFIVPKLHWSNAIQAPGLESPKRTFDMRRPKFSHKLKFHLTTKKVKAIKDQTKSHLIYKDKVTFLSIFKDYLLIVEGKNNSDLDYVNLDRNFWLWICVILRSVDLTSVI